MFKRIGRRLQVVLYVAVFASPAGVASTMTLSNGDVLKDPTQPAKWATPKRENKVEKAYKLNYLLFANDRKQAIINGVSVVEGDRVNGAKVIKISEDSVLLSTEYGSKVLRWKQPASIKRTR
ncbi:hypothetical protein [Alkalimarinus alittae]|uniref:MSHA biogenesis protein MshK n=1 Tax=Alkalimarinus alittae TaxID=2961619 RepID=A0ABY6N106_9ALTE|nr:hypothetical protein [Alkalimarinus alittae]UZE95787.1 hypothetical protein NKI27_17285 [Alkalimarinus alittae]